MEAAEANYPGPATDVLAERAAILKIVDRLPTKQRQVVMLFYMEEQSHEEVATMLAIPVGTVKTLLHRARAQLLAGATKSRSTA
jgi:RNA polymerase sigma-70 factor (ECF subfamily)